MAAKDEPPTKTTTEFLMGEVGRMIVHPYTSTACQHSLHERCRQNCKFCGTPCLCSCHRVKNQT